MRASARAPEAAERGVGLDVTQVLQTVAPARVVLDAVTMQLLKQSDQVPHPQLSVQVRLVAPAEPRSPAWRWWRCGSPVLVRLISSSRW